MISVILFAVWEFVTLIAIVVFILIPYQERFLALFIVSSIAFLPVLIPIFTGIPVKNNEGQYKGYVTAVERNGAIFKGWNVYLKTELESSNEDVACINREDQQLIERLKKAQEDKENVVLKYEGVWQYAIGVCPGKDRMIISVENN